MSDNEESAEGTQMSKSGAEFPGTHYPVQWVRKILRQVSSHHDQVVDKCRGCSGETLATAQ